MKPSGIYLAGHNLTTPCVMRRREGRASLVSSNSGVGHQPSQLTGEVVTQKEEPNHSGESQALSQGSYSGGGSE